MIPERDGDVWLRPALQKQVLLERKDGNVEIALRAPALRAPRQAIELERQLSAIDGVLHTDISTRKQRIHITYAPRKLPIPQLLKVCNKVADNTWPLSKHLINKQQQTEADDALKRLLVAGIFGMQSMMFALVLYLDVIDSIQATTIELFRWLGLLTAAPVVFYAAIPFYRHAWADLRHRFRTLGIDTPIALAVIVIYLASMWTTFSGHGETWFDSVSMLVFVLLLGRYIELHIRHKHLDANAAAISSTPLTAIRKCANGQLETIGIDEVQVNDIIHIPEGGMAPIDGIVVSQNTIHLDKSLFTGESEAIVCRPGDTLMAGSILLDSSVQIRVTQTSAQSSLTQLNRLLEHATQHASKAQIRQDKAARWFVLGIFAMAFLTLSVWLWFDPARALDATVSVLVVACPCAFALAAPATYTRAVTLAMRKGLRINRPTALKALTRIKHVLLDKTGTLTAPHIVISDTPGNHEDSNNDGGTLKIAVALARESSHPVAKALASAYPDLDTPQATQVKIEAGFGIRGCIAGKTYLLGRPPESNRANNNGHVLWLSHDQLLLKHFMIQNHIRQGAQEAIDWMQQAGINITIISGDAKESVSATAKQLGITHWYARQTPKSKHDRVLLMQEAGQPVLVVGDGNNDAAALAAANASASLTDATDHARQHSDIILQQSLQGLIIAFNAAYRTRQVLRQNRLWGLTWNILAIPFAMTGFIPPWLAALGMSTSSLIVVLNVLRMRHLTTPKLV